MIILIALGWTIALIPIAGMVIGISSWIWDTLTLQEGWLGREREHE